jgi:hypothetical protein
MTRNQQMHLQEAESPWRIHQSFVMETKGRCCWKDCPRIENSEGRRKCAYTTRKGCKECSILYGRNMFTCNNTKRNGFISKCNAFHECYHESIYDTSLDNN